MIEEAGLLEAPEVHQMVAPKIRILDEGLPSVLY